MFIGGTTAQAATFVVTNTNSSGPGSFQQAMINSEETPGRDNIHFNIPGNGPHTFGGNKKYISFSPVVIDGTTQPGYNGKPVIEFTVDIFILGGNSIVRGLCINRTGNGIQIASNGGNTIERCYIGTDVTGTQALGNHTGIFIESDIVEGSAAPTTIRTPNIISNNLISGNEGLGIWVQFPQNGQQAYSNVIRGNYIGTDATGTAPLGNGIMGIAIYGVSGNVIGGETAAARNVIAANGDEANSSSRGIMLEASQNNRVQGNYIGMGADGTTPLGNKIIGLYLNGRGNLIGGTTPGTRNIISATVKAASPTSREDVFGSGIYLAGESGNLVQGNYIGTDAAGAGAPFPGKPGNEGAGIEVVGSRNNLIGGTGPGAGNTIAFASVAGLYIGSNAQNNRVQGNVIKDSEKFYLTPGIWINGASNNLIGGTVAGAGNAIGGNSGHGIRISDSANTQVQGNDIGLTYGRNFSGVFLERASNTLIGGTTAGARNIISNNVTGITLQDSGAVQTGMSANRIQGNYIGTNATGTAAAGNSGGIYIRGTSRGNIIGGTTAAARNIISSNGTYGIYLINSSSANIIQGNYIGTDVTGTKKMGNTFGGIDVFDSSADNLIGGTIPGARNVISGNGTLFDAYGVSLNSSAGNVLQGNFIGTDASGLKPLGNTADGVVAAKASHTIGGVEAGAGNVIAFNKGAGVRSGGQSKILGNSIFSNGQLGIDVEAQGVTENSDTLSSRQNFPLLTAATVGSTTVVEGTLQSALPAEVGEGIYRIEFFANSVCDPSGYGEGQIFIGSTEVRITSSTPITFRAILSKPLPLGTFISATATREGTSEYSACIRVTPERTPPTVSIASPTNGAATNYLSLVRGLATDAYPGSGILRVDLIIVRRSDNRYWNGAEWVDTPVRLSTILQGTSWYRNTAMPGTLEEGLYTIQAVAIDRAGNAASSTVNIIADRRAPTVSIDIPSNGEKLFYISLVRGTAIDPRDALGRAGSDIDRVELLIIRRSDNRYWNGQTWVSAVTPLSTILQGTTWYRSEGLPTNEDLTPGQYMLQAVAYDRAGNRAIDIINVTVPVSQ